jgi:hypothetical protein
MITLFISAACSDYAQQYFGGYNDSIFRVTELVQADAEVMWWKKMCLLYRKV